MGVCSYDLLSKERKLESVYQLNNSQSLENLFYDYGYLHERQYLQADFAAVVLLLDLQNAKCQAKLTERQETVLEFWKQQYTLEEIGFEMGIAHQTVDEHLKRACEKIADVFIKWENEGLT